MLETSKDFLFIILAFCILWLTIFFSWILFYIIKIFKNSSRIIDKAQGVVDKADDFVETIKKRFDKSAAGFSFLGEMAKHGMDFVNKKCEEKADRSDSFKKRVKKVKQK